MDDEGSFCPTVGLKTWNRRSTMRRWSLSTLVGVAWTLSLAAFAAEAGPASIPWSDLVLVAAMPESPALGPDLLAAGPEGQIALWNPAAAQIHVYPSLDAVRAGDAASSFAVPAADALAWTDAGVLVLDDGRRRLDLYATTGQLVDSVTLPGLVPPGCQLDVDGDVVRAVDLFSNRRGIATISSSGLAPAPGGALQGPSLVVRWDQESRVLTAGDRELTLPHALKASGRIQSSGADRWLIIEAVVGDSPVRVSRQALSLRTGKVVDLPVTGRLYAPGSDLSVDGRGHLVWMAPMADGLHVGEVTP